MSLTQACTVKFKVSIVKSSPSMLFLWLCSCIKKLCAYYFVVLVRCKAADDLALTEMEVTAIAEDLEVKLYNVHNQEVNSKYRNRLRSLLFNLKDTKNKVRTYRQTFNYVHACTNKSGCHSVTSEQDDQTPFNFSFVSIFFRVFFGEFY